MTEEEVREKYIYIQNDFSNSEARIVQLGIDICRALEICERRDVIHRDIKPDNIMMSEFENFKLGDFGIARTMEKTMSASMAGTDWYMMPEVAKKMKYRKRNARGVFRNRKVDKD